MRVKVCLLFLCSLLILTGCWDQQLLKEARLVYGSSFDLNEDNSILTTSVIRSLKQSSRGAAQTEATNVIISATGNTLRETRTKIDRKLAGEYAPNKTRVFILGEDIAKTDIYPILDILYRDPRSALGAKLLVTTGKGENILKLNQVEEVLISEEVLELVKSAENNTIVSEETIQSICPIMFDQGEDFSLPLIERTKEKVVSVKGMALFNGRTYTGIDLVDDDSILFLLMNNQMSKFAKFTLEVNPDEINNRNRFISIQVKENNPKIKVNVSNDNDISVDLFLNLKVVVMEYPKDELSSEKVINSLNEKLTNILTAKAENMVKLLQEANCDAFGIGRELISFHPVVWNKLNWKEVYPTITMSPKVQVEIVGTGIIK